jgi:hypothetical protein
VTDRLYVLSVDAEADSGNEVQLGERRPLLVLARAASPAEASDVALVALTQCRWRDARLDDVAPFVTPVEMIQDAAQRAAAIHARDHGYAVIVF